MNESRLAIYMAALGSVSVGNAMAADGNDFSLPMMQSGPNYAYGNGYWDVDGDGTDDFSVYGYWGWSDQGTPADGTGYIQINDYNGGSPPYNSVVGSYIGGYYPYYGVDALSPGDTVDSGRSFLGMYTSGAFLKAYSSDSVRPVRHPRR